MVTMPKENEGGNFELAPEGTHLATCYRVIDLGTQETNFQGQSKHKRQVMLSWELPDELMSDGRPFTVHKTYTLSSDEKSTLRKHLESWRGKKFDSAELGSFNIAKLIGIAALINITHTHADNGKTYVNVESLSRLMKGQEGKPLINEPLHIDLSKFDHTAFAKLSDNLRSKIGTSPEYFEATQTRPANDDEIPYEAA